MAWSHSSVMGVSRQQGTVERGKELEVTGRVEEGSKTHFNSLIWPEELSIELDGSLAPLAAAADLGENGIEPDLGRRRGKKGEMVCSRFPRSSKW
jgi:hypothetical protein